MGTSSLIDQESRGLQAIADPGKWPASRLAANSLAVGCAVGRISYSKR